MRYARLLLEHRPLSSVEHKGLQTFIPPTERRMHAGIEFRS